MNQAVGTIWNVLSGIFANIGGTATQSMKIQHDAVYVQESSVSIQPQVMAGAAFLLVVAIIVMSRK